MLRLGTRTRLIAIAAVGALSIGLLAIGGAEAAYIGSSPLQTQMDNTAGQPVGTTMPLLDQPVIPLITQPAPSFVPAGPQQTTVNRFGNFLDSIGRAFGYITDGLYYLTLAPPSQAPQPGQAAVVMNQSPNPSLQCPYTAAVNQSANTTVITNPGGKAIHVCGIVLVNGGTAQSVSVAEGTGTACGTNTVFWDGGSGGTVQLAVNGGYVAVNQRIIYPMQVAGDNVCVLLSGSTNVSGHINYGVFNR